MKYTIIPITIKEILPYKKDAEKAGLVFCSSTIYYGLYLDDAIEAFTGIIIKKNKAIFKNSFVPEKNRGKGYFKMLLKYRLDIVRHLNIKIVEATCTKMSIRAYLDIGFAIVKQYKLYAKVRHENIQ